MAFLAYCLSVSLRQQLKRVAWGLTPRAVLEKMATLQMIDVRIPTTDGRELLLICRTEPNKDAALILSHLGLDLPPQPPPKIQALKPTPMSWRPLESQTPLQAQRSKPRLPNSPSCGSRAR